ncbi:related to NUP42 - nuclear pore protein [Cephalotrichum gorgonifer]|uniref:Related to NUP42 - nuclear pore protein n=1 Tax=Cephalotrichum gorgonifer TaxID=2041049 RepID=A0AAE8MUH8_9PEZI|nr:related to NUP42 - nuclear pore protein [Cephalotrichum gorgonifer]
MVVCRFYQSGACKFGDQCKFEHPGASRSQNRFSAFGGGAKTTAISGSLPYSLSKEAIEKDLTSEAPTWILSCYGPGRDAPEQLFGGFPREQSTDEIRLHYEKGVQAGKQQEAIQEINQLYENAKNQMQTAVSNLDNAIQFITDGANKHPNRQTIVDSTNPAGRTPGEFAVGKRMNPTSSNPFSSGGTSTTSAFGSAPATGSAFGQPSALGQTPNPFGQPTPSFGQQGGGAFGKPAAPAFGATSTPTSAFGSASTTSAFGSTSTTSAFGQPSGAFGQPSQTGGSAFGQTSGMGQRTSAFGTPAAPAFGQTGGGSAFGQPSQLGSGGSAFGQPSGMGQKPSPFGAPAASSGGSGFSAFANAAKTSPFGATAGQGQPVASNPFAAATGQPVASSPFGAVAAQGQPAASSPFGAAAAAGQPVASNPFAAAQGQAAQAAPNPFSKSDGMGSGMDSQPTSGGFGTQQAASSPFGQQQQAAPNPFGPPNPSPFGSAAAASAPAPAGDAGNPYPPGSEKQHPPLGSYASVSMGRLSAWKGRPVNYKGDVPGYISGSGKWTRIWFPAGPPGYYADTEVAGGQLADEAKRAWEGFKGRFDVVPEVPPLRIHCQWDI